MHHELKILDCYFQAVAEGKKTFEIRLDDRGYQAGDTVTLNEISGLHKMMTGRRIEALQIGYVTAYEQKEGYVVFSLIKSTHIKKDE